MWTISTVVLVLSITSIVVHANSEEKSNLNLKEHNFVLIKQDSNGYEELILGHNGVIGLRRTAIEDEDSLQLHEITNGTFIVQLVFSPLDTLVDCDASTSEEQMKRLSNHVSSKLSNDKRYGHAKLQHSEIRSLTDLDDWNDKCQRLHSENLGGALPVTTLVQSEEKESHTTVTIFKPDVAESINEINKETEPKKHIKHDLMHLEEERTKRGIANLIYPGTKWCGKGNAAKHHEDLGPMKATDMCCRQHDMCSETILPLSTGYNYFNYGFLTLSSCKCDAAFKHCLQRAAIFDQDSIADLIGHLYFNVIGMKCFMLEELDQCTMSSWWGRCMKTEKRLAATFKELLTY